jgi:hypothetical protein
MKIVYATIQKVFKGKIQNGARLSVVLKRPAIRFIRNFHY